MADQAEATPPDPFDLGDTSLSFEPKEETPAVTERPRGPDGKFLPIPKPEAAEPAVAVTEPAAVTSKHPAYLVEQARQAGYSDDEIDAMPTNVLGKTLHLQMRQQLAMRQQFDRERTLSEGQVRTPQPTPKEDEPDIDFGTDEEGRPLTAADFHPGIVKALKNMSKSQRDEAKALRAELTKRDERDNQREMVRVANVYDAAFVALGPDYEHLIGKGPGRGMGEAQKAEYRRRIAILTEAQCDPRQNGVAQVKATVKAAADLLFPPVKAAPYAEVAKPEANGKPKPKQRITPEEWEEAALAKPTQRKAEEVKGEALAVRNLAAKMDREVIPDSEELEGFM